MFLVVPRLFPCHQCNTRCCLRSQHLQLLLQGVCLSAHHGSWNHVRWRHSWHPTHPHFKVQAFQPTMQWHQDGHWNASFSRSAPFIRQCRYGMRQIHLPKCLKIKTEIAQSVEYWASDFKSYRVITRSRPPPEESREIPPPAASSHPALRFRQLAIAVEAPWHSNAPGGRVTMEFFYWGCCHWVQSIYRFKIF